MDNKLEDPIVMYLIVRESLGMSIGKTAAQCAHASSMLSLLATEMSGDIKEYEGNLDLQRISEKDYKIFLDKELYFSKWLDSGYRKIVLRADEKEWLKLKENLEACDAIVVDYGLTELEPQTETVIGLFPMPKSKCGKLIKRLQVLK